MSKIEEIFELVIKGNAKELPRLVKEAVDAGEEPKLVLNDGMIAAMDEIGAKFTKGEIFVPEMMISANAMKKGLESLKPYLSDEDSAGTGRVVIGTVAGDLHDIGKNLVAMMLESSGFDVIDLGCDVAPEDFVSAVKNNPNVSFVCCSALLTTTMPAMKTVVDALEDAGLRDQVTVMIGGAPVTQAFCDEIGADVYTDDAGAATQRAKELATA